MNFTTSILTALLNRIPRRHSAGNVKEIYGLLTGYEERQFVMEALNPFYEKNRPLFFDTPKEITEAIPALYTYVLLPL
jgi:hypothetical protein